MRRSYLWPMVSLCVALAPVTTRAAVTEDNFLARSTGDLVELCGATPSEPMGTAALNFCHGFGVGVFRVLQEIEQARKVHMFCMPTPPPSRNETVAKFLQWAGTNPAQLGMPPQDGVIAFLVAQYPCGGGKK